MVTEPSEKKNIYLPSTIRRPSALPQFEHQATMMNYYNRQTKRAKRTRTKDKR